MSISSDFLFQEVSSALGIRSSWRLPAILMPSSKYVKCSNRHTTQDSICFQLAIFTCQFLSLACWCNGYHVGLVIVRFLVRLPAVPLPGNNPGQVVYTHVPLSPSSIIWYRPNRREGNDSIWESFGLPPI